MKQLIRTLLFLACALPLSGLCLAVQEEAPTAEQVYDDLNEEVHEAYGAWVEDLMAKIEVAEKEGKDMPQTAYTPPYKPFIPRFQARAKQFAGTEGAVPFLVWLAEEGMNVDMDAGKQAVRTLIQSHIHSESFSDLAPMLPALPRFFDEDEAAAMLARVEKGSKDSTVRAWAILARLSKTLEHSEMGSEAYEAAKKEMRAAMENVKDARLTNEVGQKIDVRETFSIGMVAPDIEGIDIDGTAFKLSDYKGKVLFVDFWGDW